MAQMTIYKANITRVTTYGIWAEVPVLATDMEFGPLETTVGAVYEVGDKIVVGQLAGVSEDLIALGKIGDGVQPHTHDDRYFTEAEVTALLAGKSSTGHIHDDRYYTKSQSDVGFYSGSNPPAFANVSGTIYDNQLPDRLQYDATPNPRVTDFNSASLAGSGWYLVDPPATNGPGANSYYYLEVVQIDGGWRTQTAWQLATEYGVVYRRHWQSGSTWGAWYKVRLSEAELDSRYFVKSANNNVYGRSMFESAAPSGASGGASVEVRSSSDPSIYFHKPGVDDALLKLRPGFLAAVTSDGSAYKDFRAGSLYDADQRVYSSNNQSNLHVDRGVRNSGSLNSLTDPGDYHLQPGVTGGPTPDFNSYSVLMVFKTNIGVTQLLTDDNQRMWYRTDWNGNMAARPWVRLMTETDFYASAVVRVIHAGWNAAPRPAGAAYVEWVGSVAPTNMTTNDTWVNTSL